MMTHLYLQFTRDNADHALHHISVIRARYMPRSQSSYSEALNAVEAFVRAAKRSAPKPPKS